MSEPIVVTLPEALSERVREIAAAADRSVEQLIIDHLEETLVPHEPVLPADLQAELDAMRDLSDDALWAIAREQMPNDVQGRAHDLMDKNTFGTITEDEYEELGGYVERSNGMTLRKAEAAVILRARGYAFTPADFTPRP
jgi:hypothetical protein